MSEYRFFLVWCDGADSRGYIHNSYSDAMSDAERLAKVYVGQKWYVLEAKEYMQVNDVHRQTLRIRNDASDIL